MASLLDDIDSASTWISEALRSSGYAADFGPASLWTVDRFFDEHASGGKAVRGGLLAEDLGSRLFALGAYTGEVIRRSVGGTWSADENDPEGEINVQLALPDGTRMWPVQRVMKRFRNGAEDGIALYGMAVGLDVGPAPAAPPPPQQKRRFFGRGH